MTSAGKAVGPGHRVLGRYELVARLGSGSGGTVWQAHDHTLGRTVALKHVTFPASTAAQEAEADQKRARTRREARLAATLRSPHVVAIHDQQEIDGDLWLVLEYVPSRSLADVLDEASSLPPREAAGIGAAVADALADAHDHGITHRDVKPGNVLLGTEPGVVKLADFGIAHSEVESELTGTGVVTGTPAYMAPEQARGEACTSESDVFSLGATVYRAVEGSPPFGSDGSYIALMHRVAYESVRPPERAGTLGPLLMQLLEPDPATRPDARTAARLLRRYAGRANETTDPSAVGADPDATIDVTGETVPSARPARETIPPGAAPPRPPAAASGRPWWRRATVVAAAVLAVLVVVGVVLTASGVLRSDPTAVPELPDEVPDITLTGDPTTADPCALLDAAVMSRFGVVRVRPGENLGQCRATVDTPDGRRSRTQVHYSNTGTEQVTPVGPPRVLGSLSIVPAGTTSQGCTTYLRLADNTLVGIGTENASATLPPPDLCAFTDAAVAVAVDRLAENGIVHTPGWQGPVSLAGKKACEVAGDTTAVVPGLNGLRRSGYPNGTNCFLGDGRPGLPYAYVTFGLVTEGNVNARYGTFAPVDGKATFTRQTRGYYSPTACRVLVVHRQSYDAGVSGPTEYVAAQVEGSSPVDQLCGQARDLSRQAERNAG